MGAVPCSLTRVVQFVSVQLTEEDRQRLFVGADGTLANPTQGGSQEAEKVLRTPAALKVILLSLEDADQDDGDDDDHHGSFTRLPEHISLSGVVLRWQTG